jgi:hypothetical protein
MTKQNNPKDDLVADFRALGDNLMEVLRKAWERPEREKLQQDIEAGISELGATLSKAATEIEESEIGKRVKEGVGDFQSKVDSGEVEKIVRSELQSALSVINSELEKLAKKIQVTVDSASDGSSE